MKFSDRKENIFAACLILFFFFPWINFFIISFNGFNLPKAFNMLAKFSKISKDAPPIEPALLYTFYLIPILSVLYLFLTLKKDKNYKILSVFIGLIPISGFIYALIKIGDKIFDLISIGAYLTIISGICIILASLGIIKPKVLKNDNIENKASNEI